MMAAEAEAAKEPRMAMPMSERRCLFLIVLALEDEKETSASPSRRASSTVQDSSGKAGCQIKSMFWGVPERFLTVSPASIHLNSIIEDRIDALPWRRC